MPLVTVRSALATCSITWHVHALCPPNPVHCRAEYFLTKTSQVREVGEVTLNFTSEDDHRAKLSMLKQNIEEMDVEIISFEDTNGAEDDDAKAEGWAKRKLKYQSCADAGDYAKLQKTLEKQMAKVAKVRSPSRVRLACPGARGAE